MMLHCQQTYCIFIINMMIYRMLNSSAQCSLLMYFVSFLHSIHFRISLLMNSSKLSYPLLIAVWKFRSLHSKWKQTALFMLQPNSHIYILIAGKQMCLSILSILFCAFFLLSKGMQSCVLQNTCDDGKVCTYNSASC